MSSSPKRTHSPSSVSPDLRTPAVKEGHGPHRSGDGWSTEGAAAARPGSVPLLLVEDADIPSQNCLRLVLLGSARVGKTSIVSRFLNNKYDDKYTPTIEDFHRKIYRIRGESYRLDILDTSGNDPFPAMKRLSLLTGDLFLVVYAVDSRESFEEAIRLRNQIYEAKLGQMTPTMTTPVSGGGGPTSQSPRVRQKRFVPMVIVGNKCDLESSRVVETTELRQLTDTHPGLCDVIESSAKRNVNIEEIFLKLFMLAKVPTEMSPSLHRKVQPAYVSPSSSPRSTSSLKLMSLRRRLSDACGAVALNARRPSIRTDLLNLQTRKNQPGDGDTDFGRMDLSRCSLQ